MRLNMPREFYIPQNARPIDCAGTDAAVYLYESNGVPYAIGFHGKAAKPDWHHRFRNDDRRQEHVAGYLAGRRERAQRMANRRAEKQAWKPDCKVGDIFRTCWGYDQTNVEYFEIVEMRGKHAILREIAQERTETAFMQGKCVPVPGKYIGEPVRKLCQPHGFKMSSWGRWACKCEPRVIAGCKVYSAAHWTAYA